MLAFRKGVRLGARDNPTAIVHGEMQIFRWVKHGAGKIAFEVRHCDPFWSLRDSFLLPGFWGVIVPVPTIFFDNPRGPILWGRESTNFLSQMLLLLLCLVFGCCSGFYLPGVAPREYLEEENVTVKVNSMKSSHAAVPFDYYSSQVFFPNELGWQPPHIRGTSPNSHGFGAPPIHLCNLDPWRGVGGRLLCKTPRGPQPAWDPSLEALPPPSRDV